MVYLRMLLNKFLYIQTNYISKSQNRSNKNNLLIKFKNFLKSIMIKIRKITKLIRDNFLIRHRIKIRAMQKIKKRRFTKLKVYNDE